MRNMAIYSFKKFSAHCFVIELSKDTEIFILQYSVLHRVYRWSHSGYLIQRSYSFLQKLAQVVQVSIIDNGVTMVSMSILLQLNVTMPTMLSL
jgi:hypothetical protein